MFLSFICFIRYQKLEFEIICLMIDVFHEMTIDPVSNVSVSYFSSMIIIIRFNNEQISNILDLAVSI